MTAGTQAPVGLDGRYGELIKPDRVHGSLYTDRSIFQEELRKIWYRSWVFIGHESEVSQPNDYVRKRLGLQDIIMTRDRDGELHLLLNRCAHRGAQICDDPCGNSSTFRCPYHGWTFRNDGELVGFPFFKGYGQRKLDLPLARVPRMDTYCGFVFGSFASDGPSLVEHLGAAAGEIDRLVRLSPQGEVELTAGWLQHKTRNNWKIVVENETDGYHPQFVHGAILSVTGSTIAPLYGDSSTALTRNLGNGHSENDLRPEFRKFAEPMRWFGASESRVPDYVAAMRDRYGAEAETIMIEGGPHVMIFPNLFIAEIQVFNIQPVAVNETVQYSTAVQLVGSPDMNKRLVSQCMGSVGPAGMLLADDAEMYERSQQGVECLAPEWLDTRRGLNRERIDENGFTVGAATDETGLRSFWSQYKKLMEAES